MASGSDPIAGWYARPVHFVADMDAALDFYGRLGFTQSWHYEEDGATVATQVNRGTAEIILNTATDRGGARLFLALEDDEFTDLESRVAAAGIESERTWWGYDVLVLRDPSGNELVAPVPEPTTTRDIEDDDEDEEPASVEVDRAGLLGQLKYGAPSWNAWRRENPDVVVDLAGADLSGMILTSINFAGANLSGARLHAVNLMSADLRDADLRGADLTEADLIAARLGGARLTGAVLTEADVLGADLVGAEVSDADLEGALHADSARR